LRSAAAFDGRLLRRLPECKSQIWPQAQSKCSRQVIASFHGDAALVYQLQFFLQALQLSVLNAVMDILLPCLFLCSFKASIMLEAHSHVSEGVNFSMRLYYAWLHALRVTQRKENRDYFYESNF